MIRNSSGHRRLSRSTRYLQSGHGPRQPSYRLSRLLLSGCLAAGL